MGDVHHSEEVAVLADRAHEFSLEPSALSSYLLIENEYPPVVSENEEETGEISHHNLLHRLFNMNLASEVHGTLTELPHFHHVLLQTQKPKFPNSLVGG